MDFSLASAEPEEILFHLGIPDPQSWKLGARICTRFAWSYGMHIPGFVTRSSQRFGIREFKVAGQKILINGEEVKLVGCSKHEEYPLTGESSPVNN